MVNNSTTLRVRNLKVADVPAIWTSIEFGLLLFGEIVSIPCYFFMFYHLIIQKIGRKFRQNHGIVIMLMFNFIHLTIDLSMTLDFLRLGYRSSISPATCFLQGFVDYGIWYGAIFLMVWVSIERHILIFHSILMNSTYRRLLFHYIPLGIFTLYAPILYFYLIILYPCERVYNPLINLCGSICFRKTISSWFNWYESFVNYTIPVLLIVTLNIGLIIRVILQKRRLQQNAGWRRHRKMIIQLIIISSVYVVFDLPYVIITIVQWAGIKSFGGNVLAPYITHLTYVPAIILPYATLIIIPKLKQNLYALMIWKRNRAIIAPSN